MTAARGVRFVGNGDVGRIVLERPDAANAFDLAAAHAFAAAVDAAADEGVRVVTVTGDGGRFCAGGDVASFLGDEDPPAYVRELAETLEREFRRLSELPKPVIAGVHGAVAGAGLGLLLSCDVVVAAAGTRFVLAYSGIGLTPDCGVSYLLPRAIGQQRALGLAVTGRTLNAAEALAWGLVTEVVEDDGLSARIDELARSIADGPSVALAEAARLMRSSWEVPRREHAEDEARTIAAMVTTEDAQRLIASFLAR